MTKEIVVKPLKKDDARAFVTSINKGLGDIRAMLIALHDGKGWEALGYDSWGAFGQAEFGWSDSYLRRQITAGKIEQKLLAHDESVPIGTPATHTAPVKESHVRPLAGLNENQQVKAYTDAKADAEKAGKPLTAKDVKAKANAYKPAAPKPQPAPKTCPKCKGEDFHKDGTCAVCVQEDAPEPTVEELMAESNKALESLAREITGLHKRAAELGTPHVDEERLDIFESQCKTAAGTLRAAKGYAVCSYCDGSGKCKGKKCKPCLGCGWLTRTAFDSAPTKE